MKISSLFWGFVLGVLVCVLAPIGILATGVVNVGADMTPSSLERRIANWAVDHSVAKRAPQEKNEYVANAAAIAVGLNHYRENCVMCHGAGDVAAGELAKGLYPSAPQLDMVDDMADGELFWVVKHGIRMTPMPAFGPTHTDDEIRKIVAFIRHLPHLTKEEVAALRTAGGNESKNHHEAEANEKKETPVQAVKPPGSNP